MPDGDDTRVHYAPGDHPLCGTESMTAVYTDDPARVGGCADCLELVVEDVQDHNDYRGHCLHCRPRRGGMAPGGPEALPALREARMVERQPHLCFEGRRLGLLRLGLLRLGLLRLGLLRLGLLLGR